MYIRFTRRIISIKKEEFLNKGSLLLIKNDVVTLKNIGISMKSPANLMLLPYICFCCHEALNFMEYSFEPTNNPQTLIDYKKVRNKLKLFSQRYGKSIKQVNYVDSLQDEEFKSKLRFRWMKHFNVHYNLGVYCNSEGHIVGNTQYISFLLQNPNFILKSKNSHNLYNLSVFLGSVLQKISKNLYFLDLEPSISRNEIFINWSYKDFNTNKNFDCFPEKEDGKELTLLLLHLLSTVNFVNYEFPKYLTNDNPLLLRVKYITAYYVNESLKRIKNVNETDKRLLKKELENSIIFNSDFRSCMLHYGFYNKGKCSIDDQYLHEKPFFGLIESCFEGKNFEEYQILLDEKNLSLSNTISALLPLPLEDCKPL